MTPLEAIIAAAKAKVATEAAAKSALAGAKTAKTAAAREASLAESRRLQNELDWLPRALVLVIEQWKCACEETGNTPLGMFVYKEHARMANSSILVAPKHEADAGNNLPRMIKYTDRYLPVCNACSSQHGFLNELVDRRVQFSGATPSTPGPYVQDWLDKRTPDEEPDDDDA